LNSSDYIKSTLFEVVFLEDNLMKPLISIIVPVYKVEKYLYKCVDSILNQTYDNLEIILIDDASPDNCPIICDNYAKMDNRIIVIHKENGGVSSARNEGLDIATGQYVTFIDSDDSVEPEMIQFLYDTIQQSGSDIVSCGVITEYENGQIRKKSKEFDEITLTVEKALDFYGYYFRNEVYGKLYSRKLFYGSGRKIRFDEDIFIGEDLLFFCQCALHCIKITYSSPHYYHYLYRDGGAMRSEFNKKSLTDLNARKKINSLLEDYPKAQKSARLRFVEVNIRLIIELLHSNSTDQIILKKLRNNIRMNLIDFLLSPYPKKSVKIYSLLVTINTNWLLYVWKLKNSILHPEKIKI
jgi:glycosyltransferase involved in cell wall biosynthesis